MNKKEIDEISGTHKQVLDNLTLRKHIDIEWDQSETSSNLSNEFVQIDFRTAIGKDSKRDKCYYDLQSI